MTTEEYLFFVDRALDGMTAILSELGDERANRRPDLPGANSPYAVVHHCLGVLDFWVGKLVAGRTIERDREAEFRATGEVAELIGRVRAARERLREDVEAADPRAPLRGEAPEKYRDTVVGRSQAAALQHAYEELAQHHGQLELTRDLLKAKDLYGSGNTRPSA
ncbi:DinB family protein [Amycolatopsis rhizosphaerae]|uniref:DinB family protein n=1 Tax=Amycolatopsis rhizosphaerae TaxID=2053003 RepID=A0A558A6C6_9PSEU|nr:DinB family protein [Amycolatopsis rhizosphaerae]